jgi:hypothetical protein
MPPLAMLLAAAVRLLKRPSLAAGGWRVGVLRLPAKRSLPQATIN